MKFFLKKGTVKVKNFNLITFLSFIYFVDKKITIFRILYVNILI